MLIKDSFPLTHIFFMLPNTGKHGKLSLHKIFHRNKQSGIAMKHLNPTIFLF